MARVSRRDTNAHVVTVWKGQSLWYACGFAPGEAAAANCKYEWEVNQLQPGFRVTLESRDYDRKGLWCTEGHGGGGGGR